LSTLQQITEEFSGYYSSADLQEMDNRLKEIQSILQELTEEDI
jgi:hypothetical protein